ncbi:uncharacterized protein PB18E9.04c-like [Octopus sinensis]|uniref:Uncharacterized protein PB18E9.04c-like n=1 Tax=Octopus sinensis TaxID=2607531 RepID=A0A7E6F873_9MOLL|nr:uncharacterized protein PB18E9.04c-like [Octopus sinensis]
MTDSPELDQLIQNYEFDNEQFLKCIERENQLIKNFTRDIELTNLSVKRLQESVSQIDEDTKRVHKQYTLNRDNCASLKKTTKLLADHEDSLQKKLEANNEKYSDEMKERYKLLEHYQSVWEDFEKKYKSLKPAQILEKEMKNLTLAEKFLSNIQDEKQHVTKNMKENKLLTTQEVKGFICSIARVKTDSTKLKEKIKTLKANISEMKQVYLQNAEEAKRQSSLTTSGVTNVSTSPTVNVTSTTTTITTAASSVTNIKTSLQQSQLITTSFPPSNSVRSAGTKFSSPKLITKEEAKRQSSLTTSGVTNVSTSPTVNVTSTTTTITTAASSVTNIKTSLQQSQLITTSFPPSNSVRSAGTKFSSPKLITKEQVTNYANAQLLQPLAKRVNTPKYEELADMSRTTKYLPVSFSGVKPSCSSKSLPKSPSIGPRQLWAVPATIKSPSQNIYPKSLTVPAKTLQMPGPMPTFSLSSSSMDKLKKVSVPITVATTPKLSSMADEEHFQIQAPSQQLATFCSSPSMKNLQKQKMTSPLQPTLENVQQTSTPNEIEETALSKSENININQDAFQESTFDFNEHQRMLKKLHLSPGMPTMSHRPMFLQSDENQKQKPEASKATADSNFFLQSFFDKQDQNAESFGTSMFSQSKEDNNTDGQGIFSGFSQLSATEVDAPVEFRFSNSNEDVAPNQNGGNFFSFGADSFTSSNDQDSRNNFSFDFSVSSSLESANNPPFSLF